MKKGRIIYALIIFIISCQCAVAENFVPEQPIMKANELRAGMSGYLLTVLKGTEPEKVPVKIVSVIPQESASSMRNKILIKFTGKTKLSQGMSGSPVFMKNKLIGAVRSGWDNSDQSLAMVTPIEDMIKIFNDEELEIRNEELGMKSFTLSASGINVNSLSNLSKTLGLNISQGFSHGTGTLEIRDTKFRPGDAIAAFLVWGDVQLSAGGTVTATAKDGKFLALGHDFLKRGKVSYPSAGAVVYDTVNSRTFPFKILSPAYINGTITRDHENAIAGQAGVFPLSFSAALNFTDLDTNKKSRYNFRVVADEFLTASLIQEVYKGLIAEVWDKKSQGTLNINLRIDGPNIYNGWARRNIFFSKEDVIEDAMKDTAEIISTYLTQPFNATMPSGFILDVEATQEPRVLRIEDVTTVSKASPGDEIEVKVKLRGWRTDAVEKTFKLKIPDNASGVIEVVVRGGGIEPMQQAGIENGLKAVDSMSRMLAELKAADANNDLIIELNGDSLGEILKNILNDDNNGNEKGDYLPEELEFLSETKERRIKEGTLKIYSSDYIFDGMMKRIIHVEKNNED